MLMKSNKHFYILYLRMKKEEGVVSKNQLIGYRSAIRCIGPIRILPTYHIYIVQEKEAHVPNFIKKARKTERLFSWNLTYGQTEGQS